MDTEPQASEDTKQEKKSKRKTAPVMSASTAARYLLKQLKIEPDIEDEFFTKRRLDLIIGKYKAADALFVEVDRYKEPEAQKNPHIEEQVSIPPTDPVATVEPEEAQAKAEEDMTDDQFDAYFDEELAKVRANETLNELFDDIEREEDKSPVRRGKAMSTQQLRDELDRLAEE